jgi:hypothetical protein
MYGATMPLVLVITNRRIHVVDTITIVHLPHLQQMEKQTLSTRIYNNHSPTPMEDEMEEEVVAEEEDRDGDEEEQARQMDEEGGGDLDEEEKVVGTGSASSSSSSVYLRGPASLSPPVATHRRPVIRPEGQK